MSTVDLRLGDCLEAMKTIPAGSVDAVVTSPPYNIVREWSGGGPNSNMKRTDSKFNNEWYEDAMPEEDYQELQKQVIRECLRICRGSIFYNHKVRYAIKRRNEIYFPMDWLREFPIWTEIIWDRDGGQGGNSNRWILADERIYQIGRPVVWNGAIGTNIWRIRPETYPGHPCTFPVKLVKRCILPTTDPGMTILDPFMGSGTTGVACVQTGRNFIGIEINEGYFNIAQKRIEQAQRQTIMELGL